MEKKKIPTEERKRTKKMGGSNGNFGSDIERGAQGALKRIVIKRGVHDDAKLPKARGGGT